MKLNRWRESSSDGVRLGRELPPTPPIPNPCRRSDQKLNLGWAKSRETARLGETEVLNRPDTI